MISAFHLAVMPARHAVERRDWQAAFLAHAEDDDERAVELLGSAA